MEVKLVLRLPLILVCAFLFALGKSQSKECSSTFAHQISISNTTGHNNSACLSQPNLACKTLDYVLEEMMNGTMLRNSIKIEIEGHQILKENYNLTKLKDFALCGKNNAEIECKHGKGLVILSSRGIAIEHLLFRGCGSRQRSKDIGQIPFYSGIFLSNTVDVRINDCNINNSTGIGMTFFDVGGSVNFNNTTFRGNPGNLTNRVKSLSESDLIPVGGGLIIEFTYSGGSPPFNASNNQYNFSLCKFIQNNCIWKYTAKQQLDPSGQVGNQSSLFGCGGGMGINFKGSARNNLVVIEHSLFTDNLADWGGGYCFHFQDDSHNNTVQLSHVHVFNNHANYAGGGGRLGFFPNVKSSDLFQNYFRHTHCKFKNNYANWGGGVSIFGTYEFSENTQKDINFFKCHWLQNRGVVGSALGLLSHWPNPWKQIRQPIGKGILYIKLVSCAIEGNLISYAHEDDRKNVIGTGAIYSDIAVITMQDVSFSLNNGTALVLDWSNVNILKNVTFSGNNGSKGGAVALYGRSAIILGENATLNFTDNLAELRGGAVYAYSQGPDLKAFDVRILDRSICFFSYIKPNIPPENWTARVYFQNNIAPPKSGKSIYTDTLQFCRNYGNITEALEWKPTFNYYHDFIENNTDNHDIVTDPIIIHTNRTEWKAFLGELFYPKIFLYDEKNHSVNGLLKMKLHGVELQEQISHYVFVSNNTSATPLALETSNYSCHYDLTLSSVFTQIITYKLEDINITKCYGGYVFDSVKKKCVCLDRKKMQFGFSRCKGDGKTIYLRRGYWGTVSEEGFDVVPCPAGYCNCPTGMNINMNETNDECAFVKFDSKTEQCAKNRKGRLCGSCNTGLSVVVGKQDCRNCHRGDAKLGPLWLILMVAGLTVVVLAIIYFELDFFSGPLNSWLYTYHIIYLLEVPYSESYLDPFINFVISLTNGMFDVSSGKCIWSGMDALQKLTLEYVTPFYCLIFLYFFNKLLHYFPNLRFSNHSFHRSLVTIVIISYASVLHCTMTILQPIIINDETYVYLYADLKYFGKKHLPYAIPALLILILIVIPFPFIIVFNNFFTKKFRCMRNFIPLFEVLQSPYRAGRSWFASYYIFCRLFMVLVMIASPYFQYSRVSVFESISVIILMIFVLLQPYTNENHFFFMVDTVFLSLLCLINSFTNAMQINPDVETVKFFRILIRIATYIPLLYAVGLLMKHVYQRWNDYWQNHTRANENTGLLQ